MKHTTLLKIIIILLSLSSCSQDNYTKKNLNQNTNNDTSITINEKYESYESSGNFSFSYPSNWSIDDSFGPLVIVKTAVTNSSDNTVENISFIQEKYENIGVTTYQEYFDNSLQIGIFLNEYKLISEENVVLAGKSGNKITYEHKLGENKLFVEQYILDNDSGAIIITITRLKSNKDIYTSEFSKILDTLNIQ